jgi:hypothetical protein
MAHHIAGCGIGGNHILTVFLVVILITIMSNHNNHVLSQKRARPMVAELEMLINDPSAYNNPETSSSSSFRHSGQSMDNLVTLAETLKRLQVLDRYYSHQARPRYTCSNYTLS